MAMAAIFSLLHFIILSISSSLLLQHGEAAVVPAAQRQGAPGQELTKVFHPVHPRYIAHFTTSPNSVTIRLEVETNGYIGFGFSPDGTMHGAELFIGGVGPDGKPYSGAYHAQGHSPRQFNEAFWKLTDAKENQTHTTLEIVRELAEDGFKVNPGEIWVIWSIGEDDVTTTQHEYRGPAKITLFPFEEENLVDIHGRAADEARNYTFENGFRKYKLNGTHSTLCADYANADLEADESSWWPWSSNSSSTQCELSFKLICMAVALIAGVWQKF